MSIKLKLISPISAKCDAPYENSWDGGEDYSIMTEIEKNKVSEGNRRGGVSADYAEKQPSGAYERLRPQK